MGISLAQSGDDVECLLVASLFDIYSGEGFGEVFFVFVVALVIVVVVRLCFGRFGELDAALLLLQW